MARISSYPIDKTIQDNDAWIGTEYSNQLTRQFTAAGIAEYLNINAKISVSAQMVFKFVVGGTGSGEFSGVADSTNFSAITSLTISIVDISGQNVVQFLNYLVDSDLLINEQKQISSFGHYKITAYTIDASTTTYTLELTYIGGNGSLVNNKNYDFANFVLAGDVGDKNYEEAFVNQAQWNVTHNLNKNPSVSVIDNNNIEVYGQVTYLTVNTLKINFSQNVTGKVYLN